MEIDWVAFGAILAGVGSMLTGVATYRVARRKNGHEARSDDRDRERSGGS